MTPVSGDPGTPFTKASPVGKNLLLFLQKTLNVKANTTPSSQLQSVSPFNDFIYVCFPPRASHTCTLSYRNFNTHV